MTSFFFQRIIRSKTFYLALAVCTAAAILEIFQEATRFPNNLEYGEGVLFTPYSMWIEYIVDSNYKQLLFMLLPVLAAIPFADTYAKDKQTGFLKAIISKGKLKQYFTGMYISNFITAGLVITIPLLINIYLAFMTLPNVQPDPIVALNPADNMNIIFPALYYSHPLLHMLFYVLLAFLFAGMYATFCLSISFLSNNRFVILVSAFAIDMVLSMLFSFLGKYHWITSNFITELTLTDHVSFASVITVWLIELAIATLIITWGVKKRVVF